MSNPNYSLTDDPERYVQNNRDRLLNVLKNGDDEFTRAVVWAILDEYGDDVTLEELQLELDRLQRRDLDGN
ncbi:uncharacterized protein Nmag_0047 [Natrialba magadii ATCC 43099]|uniref:Uncharacterized protein n=1 Tax=Natrialba magadii (strain ATCC 43099 / DSM 3394 / CCM 3739 / CIP 104546 / IAM 13178 / JCM 8861 / NBRC 102185 / NCIMB 2190 / MS3) TaxID=547559 RepID=D3SVS7_NATMM|nr:hypothetical protein [Natrialba magadii]ADD03646.1 uncharacterized protein Nmag_0047 [Natrialba magadii ATCC 43099]ELY34413.1 hypothetical protein C500_00722 [Natrialba magadii ATCC 43099]